MHSKYKDEKLRRRAARTAGARAAQPARQSRGGARRPAPVGQDDARGGNRRDPAGGVLRPRGSRESATARAAEDGARIARWAHRDRRGAASAGAVSSAARAGRRRAAGPTFPDPRQRIPGPATAGLRDTRWAHCHHRHGRIRSGGGERCRTGQAMVAGGGSPPVFPARPTGQPRLGAGRPSCLSFSRCCSTGLLHALLDLPSPAALDAHPKVGASWEGFVLEELIGLAGERNAYYWRTQAGAELDLLLLLRGRRIGIEVKYADAPSMTRSMHVSIESLKLDRLYVVYPGTEAYALRPGFEVLPLPLARERLSGARNRPLPRP